MNRGYEAYNEIGVTTDVMTASGHRLVQLMFEKCLGHIDIAKSSMLSNDIVKKRQAIIKALDIVEYLRMCLNHKEDKSKDLAALLDSLYAYMQRNLVKANMSNDVVSLDEAKKVLDDIKSGWDGIHDKINK